MREALFPLVSSQNNANTQLQRFLDTLNEKAQSLNIQFKIKTTANKKAGKERWIWFEGPPSAITQSYTGDLNRVPEVMRLETQRGILLDHPVILITLNENETRAVLNTFGVINPSVRDYGAYAYTSLGTYGGQEVIHVISPQKRLHAQATAQGAIERYAPSALIAVGITFGTRPKKQKIGDVLVSEYLCDYESARRNADGSITPRGPRPPASPRLFQRIQNLQHHHGPTPTFPSLHFGPLLCGDKLIDDPRFLSEVMHYEPETIGGEMEGAGIEAAARATQTDWIVIKGISDWGDGNPPPDKEKNQCTATHNADILIKMLLETGPLLPPSTVFSPINPALQASTLLTTALSFPLPSATTMGLRDLHCIDHTHFDYSVQSLPTQLHAKPAFNKKLDLLPSETGIPVLSIYTIGRSPLPLHPFAPC